jgi:hypothetical protein
MPGGEKAGKRGVRSGKAIRLGGLYAEVRASEVRAAEAWSTMPQGNKRKYFSEFLLA